MGFLKPKVPKPAPVATAAATPAPETNNGTGIAPIAASLISTSVQGLKRRASTERTSLIGGA